MRAAVSCPSVSVWDHGEESRRLATSSPDTSRSFSPAANSVLSISEKAVASHPSSTFPERLRRPRTATDFRTGTGPLVWEERTGVVAGPCFLCNPTPANPATIKMAKAKNT